jgi:hypothetical protein
MSVLLGFICDVVTVSLMHAPSNRLTSLFVCSMSYFVADPLALRVSLRPTAIAGACGVHFRVLFAKEANRFSPHALRAAFVLA